MPKLFNKRISPLYVVIAGLIVIILFLLLQLGYGSLIKTVIYPAPSYETCVDKAMVKFNACDIASQKLVGNAQITALQQCFNTYQKEYALCLIPTYVAPHPFSTFPPCGSFNPEHHTFPVTTPCVDPTTGPLPTYPAV